MWLHVRLSSMTYEVKSLIDQGNLPTILAHSSAQRRKEEVEAAPMAWHKAPGRRGSSHENMWLHVRFSSMTYGVKSLIDQGKLPTILAHSSAVGSHRDHNR
uniref:Uncharacterized protein n=1 Tax=Oryza punctata TaxID=4537 RepID=A0A0E0KN35_ORYPU